jgi:hypothetical protein
LAVSPTLPAISKEQAEKAAQTPGVPPGMPPYMPIEKAAGAGMVEPEPGLKEPTWGDPVNIAAGLGALGGQTLVREGLKAGFKSVAGAIPGFAGAEIGGGAASAELEKLPTYIRLPAEIGTSLLAGMATHKLFQMGSPEVLRQTVVGGKPVAPTGESLTAEIKNFMGKGMDYKTAYESVAGKFGITPNELAQAGREITATAAVTIPGATTAAQKQPPPITETEMYGGGPTTQQIVKAATPGFNWIRNAKQGIQSLLLPTAKTPEHLSAAEVLGSKLGGMYRMGESAAKALRPFRTAFDKVVHDPDVAILDNPGLKFMSDMSQGRPMSADMQGIANKVQDGFQTRLKQLEDAGAGLETVRENYFPGMWNKDSIRAFNQAMDEAVWTQGKGLDPTGRMGGDVLPVDLWTTGDKEWVRNRVGELLKAGEGSDKDALNYLTRKPFKGKESFRKQKVFDDIMTGAEFGLKPISNNPIDLVQLKYAEMDRSIMANKALREWEGLGDVINVNNSGGHTISSSRPVIHTVAKEEALTYRDIRTSDPQSMNRIV